MLKLSRSSTLFFTSSEPVESEVGDLRKNPGSVYRCNLQNYGNECGDSRRLTVGLDTAVSPVDSGWFSLMNLHFFRQKLSSEMPLVNRSDYKNDILEDDDDGNSFSLYASTVHPSEYKGVFSWKILKANAVLPLNGDYASNTEAAVGDNDLLFHPYFRTISEFDWNNCNFQCCPFGDNVLDSNGWATNRNQNDLTFQHSYVRTKPRTFAVDHRTGEIFIAWEGFYQNCNHNNTNQVLEWTIGVSRLLTHAENPACVSVTKENGEVELPPDFGERGNNFVSCTEPVTIFDVDSRREIMGRGTALAYGGFAVVPAATESPSPGVKPRRSFLLSVFRKEKSGDELGHSHLWAAPEGVDVSRNLGRRQNLTTSKMSTILEFESSLKGSGVWNGGNIKVHYNRQTGNPDYLCRSVFTEGIRCMPIEFTKENDSVQVASTGSETSYLTRIQVKSFCDTGQKYAFRVNSTENAKRSGKYVSGLDVMWNEEDGTPFKIFFGCVGIESNGRLGSVDWFGGNPVEVLPGAYSGDVLLFPGNPVSLDIGTQPPLPKSDFPGSVTSTTITASSNTKRAAMMEPRGIAIICVMMVVVCISLYVFYRKRFSSIVSSKKSTSPSARNEINKECRLEIPNTQNVSNATVASNEVDENLQVEIPSTQNVFMPTAACKVV